MTTLENNPPAQVSLRTLCITTGGSDHDTTPLATDTDFVMASNPSGDYFHIQWRRAYGNDQDDIVHDDLVRAGGLELAGWQDITVGFADASLPAELPIVEVESTAAGALARFPAVETKGHKVRRRAVRGGRTAMAEVDGRSGGFNISLGRERAPTHWENGG